MALSVEQHTNISHDLVENAGAASGWTQLVVHLADSSRLMVTANPCRSKNSASTRYEKNAVGSDGKVYLHAGERPLLAHIIGGGLNYWAIDFQGFNSPRLHYVDNKLLN
jgi:hypothetical protein